MAGGSRKADCIKLALLYYTVLYCTVLYYGTELCCMILHCTALHCTALYCTAPYLPIGVVEVHSHLFDRNVCQDGLQQSGGRPCSANLATKNHGCSYHISKSYFFYSSWQLTNIPETKSIRSIKNIHTYIHTYVHTYIQHTCMQTNRQTDKQINR